MFRTARASLVLSRGPVLAALGILSHGCDLARHITTEVIQGWSIIGKRFGFVALQSFIGSSGHGNGSWKVIFAVIIWRGGGSRRGVWGLFNLSLVFWGSWWWGTRSLKSEGSKGRAWIVLSSGICVCWIKVLPKVYAGVVCDEEVYVVEEVLNDFVFTNSL